MEYENITNQRHDLQGQRSRLWCHMVRLSGVGPKVENEIGRKVAHPTGNIAHLFQGQKVEGQGQQKERKCIMLRSGKAYEL